MTSPFLKTVAFFAAVTFIVALATPAQAGRPKPPNKEDKISQGTTVTTEEKPATSTT
ncbi:hypothetical protein [Luteolibacter yonseiensis]|uniref:hypothetical protein n=1 Tax=Luteolibacter yonseiensis TaxID=1144680 RepID=UPI0031E7CBD6